MREGGGKRKMEDAGVLKLLYTGELEENNVFKGLRSCTQWDRSKPCWSRWIDSLCLSRLWIRPKVPIIMAKHDLPTGMPLGLTEPIKTLSSQDHFCFHKVRLKLAAGTNTASSHLDWCPCSHRLLCHVTTPSETISVHQDTYNYFSIRCHVNTAECMPQQELPRLQ